MEKNNANKTVLIGLSVALAVFGVVALYLIYSIFTVHNKAEAKAEMQKMIGYISRQCVRYDDIYSESETKSLMAMIDKINLIRRDLSTTHEEDTADALAEYVQYHRLTGIIVMNTATGETTYNCEDGLTPADWHEILARFSTALGNRQKCYAERLAGANGCYYDYVMAALPDRDGVIFGYLKQDAKTAVGTSMSVSTLLEDFEVSSINIIVTDGANIVAATTPGLTGQPVGGCSVVEAIRTALGTASGTEKMVRFTDSGNKYYAMRGRTKGYYVYTYLTEKEVFTERKLALAYLSVVYALLIGAVFLVYNRAVSAKEKERRKSEEIYIAERERLAGAAMRANEAKTDFLRRMSHDIRTPINGIQGLIRIGNYYADDPDKQRYCREKAMETSGYLLDLVNDILDMSKLDSGEMMWRDESFNMETLLSEVVSMMSYQAAEHGIMLRYEPGEFLTPQVYGGKMPFKRICVNLLSNAVKYNKNGGSITFSARQLPFGEDARRAIFEIVCRDTGIGMSEEFQKRMYEPFAQENVSCKSSYGGTGLGLAIVKRLTDRMGGEISAHSVQGEGTEFTLKLPFLTDTAPADTGATSADPGTKELDGVKILLVEDNTLNTEIAEFMLTTAGATVVKATNGEEAVKIFAASKPDTIRVILMDVMMPVMDGLQATRAIRTLDRADALRVPIIAMTANAYDDDVERALEAGMNEYIAKPVEMRKLIDTVKKVL